MLAIEFGEICDGKDPSEYVAITEDVAWVLRKPEGELIGFIAHGLEELDPEAIEELWDGPRFDVPVLGLRGALAGEVALSALANLRDEVDGRRARVPRGRRAPGRAA